MRVTVIDAQGGGIGKAVVKAIKEKAPDCMVIAVGTNAVATTAMLKAGADVGATGENAVVYNCAKAQVLIAPIGLTLANAMYGEISPAMARAVGECEEIKILIPVKQCSARIAGLMDKPQAAYIQDAVEMALNEMKNI